MKFTEEKKQAVLRYILEKISQQDPRVTKTVSETMDINQNTVHSYITELIEQGVIRRVKRGQYELVRKQYKFCLERSKGDLDSDLYAYQKYLAPIIQDEPKNVQGIWAYAFTEMINNVMDHSLASEVHIRSTPQSSFPTTAWESSINCRSTSVSPQQRKPYANSSRES